MKILLAIATLGAGGAERVITLLADAFADRGHQVTLLTLDSTGSDFFRVSHKVVRIALGRYGPSRSWRGRLYANLARVLAIRTAVDQARPEAVVSFITEMNVLTLLACAGRRVPVLVSERVDPRIHKIGRAWNWLRWITYRRAAGVVVQTQTVAEWVAARGGMPPICVIPNPVLPAGAPDRIAPHGTRAYLFAAGRLSHQKGFDLAIRALALLVRQGADLDLVIAGEGPEETALRRLAHESGVSERVRFIGRVADLDSWMEAAFAFVLASRYEGFPNVLLEALACGAATIATDCPSGPREILEDGRHGILVPCEDAGAIARAVTTLRTDPGLRARLRSAGPSVVDRFGVHAVATRWEALLQRILLS
jgi:GalNAc-alpha-(1->4)-GalNAc-alpha-(1->3)-diNAcBac-PP-undecaprenol alpha-1,4-N-acetyl-D-galactosaminyltransferase